MYHIYFEMKGDEGFIFSKLIEFLFLALMLIGNKLEEFFHGYS